MFLCKRKKKHLRKLHRRYAFMLYVFILNCRCNLGTYEEDVAQFNVGTFTKTVGGKTYEYILGVVTNGRDFQGLHELGTRTTRASYKLIFMDHCQYMKFAYRRENKLTTAKANSILILVHSLSQTKEFSHSYIGYPVSLITDTWFLLVCLLENSFFLFNRGLSSAEKSLYFSLSRTLNLPQVSCDSFWFQA